MMTRKAVKKSTNSKAKRRTSTTKALRDIAVTTPVVAARRMKQLSTMSPTLAASRLSELTTEKNRMFAELMLSSWMMMARTQLSVWRSLSANSGVSSGRRVASLISDAGDEIAHRSAATVAKRLRRNLTN